MGNNNNAFILSASTLTITTGGKVFTIARTDASFPAVKQALNEERWEDIEALLDKAKGIQNFSEGKFTVVGNQVFVDGQAVPQSLAMKIISFMEQGFPYKPLLRFWKRLRNNPSYRAVNELYGFLEAANIPILEDGRILCYKVVSPYSGTPNVYRKGNQDVTVTGNAPKIYVDIYTGTIPQGIGDVVSMPRNSVDEDSSRTCSQGLHVCSFEYTNHYGNANSGSDVVVEVAVCPSKVVAIPRDYNNTKMRCEEYQIIGENKELTERRQAYLPSNQFSSNFVGGAEWDDDDYDTELDDEDLDDDFWDDEVSELSDWADEDDEEADASYEQAVVSSDLSRDYFF